jgi:hypothetical protein
VSIVTKGDTSTILFDGSPISSIEWEITSFGYWYAAFPITPGAHCITVTSGSSTLFGAYCYGHSQLTWSTSAYGYTVAFAGTNCSSSDARCAPENSRFSFFILE